MAIKENPKITRAELQNITGLSESGVKKILRQLQQKGLLSRIGPDKGGHWEIIDKYHPSPCQTRRRDENETKTTRKRTVLFAGEQRKKNIMNV